MAGTFTLTPQTRVTLSMVAAAASFAYWLIGLAHRVDAMEAREQDEAEFRHEILQRLDAMAVDVAGIESRLSLLIEWSDIKRKRAERP